ncbi:hypothetical protein LDENG_00078410 [Lucifuga dentata]|nr:hypothetical protein LDENG_00078410 [Lucifuga dentata]
MIVCSPSPPLLRPPAVKMHRHRPASRFPFLLPAAFWIFCYVNGVYGALPTTRN